ncbi:spore protease YyaC [Metabacillus sp. GX 13764]|uniref:spore protease YyaC n=1 Tax=Metabacillus kandeliae TaxID=2900151 RepID=UPI001E41AB60|nr:spore protease YyaC [Metabacillus kandeliae]MCD7035292.1 spore protease YyaC [Metabacillus kandeliae]
MNLKTGLFSPFNNEPEKISYEDENALELLSAGIHQLLPKILHRPIVILCIGTDRSTGDSLGPLVGSKLLELMPETFHIYGTLKNPVHAVNLEASIEEIHRTHRHPFIIAIDACLGRLKSVGTFQLAAGPVKPGAGVNKELPAVGDMHITGIVNVSGFMEFFVLQNTRLHLVFSMANLIAAGLMEAEKKYLETSTPQMKSWMNRSIRPSESNI